jgi:CRP/FNR family transcriptional regulator, cyclic AMP receptor protein
MPAHGEESSPDLSGLAFTADLVEPQRARLAQIALVVQWAENVTVFREGDSDVYLYVVSEGRVAIEVNLPGRGDLTILTVGPGEVFGWSSLFYQRPKTATARTVLATRAVALDAARLRELCDDDPKLGYVITRNLLQVVAERLKATRMQLLDLYGQ